MGTTSTIGSRVQQGNDYILCLQWSLIILKVTAVNLKIIWLLKVYVCLLFRSEEQAIFDGILIAKDDEFARFMDYVHSSTNHANLHNFTIFTYKTKRTLFEQVWTANHLQCFRSLGEVSVEGSGQRCMKRQTRHQEKQTRRAWNSLCVIIGFSFVP